MNDEKEKFNFKYLLEKARKNESEHTPQPVKSNPAKKTPPPVKPKPAKRIPPPIKPKPAPRANRGRSKVNRERAKINIEGKIFYENPKNRKNRKNRENRENRERARAKANRERANHEFEENYSDEYGIKLNPNNVYPNRVFDNNNNNTIRYTEYIQNRFQQLPQINENFQTLKRATAQQLENTDQFKQNELTRTSRYDNLRNENISYYNNLMRHHGVTTKKNLMQKLKQDRSNPSAGGAKKKPVTKKTPVTKKNPVTKKKSVSKKKPVIKKKSVTKKKSVSKKKPIKKKPVTKKK